MALTITSRGTGTHNTGASTLVPGGRNATLAAGSLGVLCMALDNAGSAGSTLIAPDSWTDAKGNVWTLRQNALYDNGAASAGIEMAIYTAPITVALLTTDAGTMTWKTGVSPVAKAWTWYEVIPSASHYADYQTGGTIAGATAANAQVTTASIAVGDGVIAGYFSENVAAVTGDSDSTNGSWTAQQTATVGSTTSGVRIATQQKVQTTTPSTQSYDVTVSSQDRIAGYIAVTEIATDKTGSFTATGGGVTVEVGSKAASAGVTATGGGVAVEAGSKGGQGSFASTGGGVAAEAGFGDRQLALAATGGGILTWDYSVASTENHDGAVAATGGGVATVSDTSDRLEAFGATGGGVVAVDIATNRDALIAATGGGLFATTGAPAKSGSFAATGSGAASVSVESARELALLLSGGGVIATDQTTERFADLSASGGGSAAFTGTQGEDHPGSFTATGGGVWDLAALSSRLAGLQASGGGAASLEQTSARLVSLGVTGGGRFTIATAAPPPLPLPGKPTVGVEFDPVPTIDPIFIDPPDLEVIL